MNTRTVAITALAITLLGSLYYLSSPSLPSFGMSSTKSHQGIPGLEFSLSQISRNPPSVLVTLKNKHPTQTYTLLKWNTPLDPSAANLGIFKLVDADTGDEVHTAIIKISRKMPPSAEDLVTVMPDTEEATEVVFDKPWFPEKRPAKYRVKAEGQFGGVWKGYGDVVGPKELEAYTDSPLNGRTFATKEVLLTVH